MKYITTYIKKTIEGRPIVLATINEDGIPHLIGVTCYKVIGKTRILLCDTYMEKTLENIYMNKNVTLFAWNEYYEGYEFIGKVKYSTKGKWFRICKELKEKKNLPCKGALLVDIKKIVKSKNKKRKLTSK